MKNSFLHEPLGLELVLSSYNPNSIKFYQWHNEFWKKYPDVNFPYMVSCYGRVISIPRLINNRFRSYYTDSIYMSIFYTNGYKRTALRNISGKQIKFTLHSLVARTFLPYPVKSSEKYIVNHKDVNKSNNYFLNLEWTTYLENSCHFLCSNKQYKTSKYIGVWFVKRKGSWQVKIKNDKGEDVYRNFKDEDEAGEYYKKYVDDYGINNRYLRVNI